MGSAPSIFASKSQIPSALQPQACTSEEIQLCETTWKQMVSRDDPAPISNPHYESFRLFFYSNCYFNLKDQILTLQQVYPPPVTVGQQNHQVASKPQDPETIAIHELFAGEYDVTAMSVITDFNTLHTIITFALKLLPFYFKTSKSNQNFQKYSKSLALSSNHLGIRPNDLIIFEKAFLLTIQSCFPDQPVVHATWCKLFQYIMSIVVPECQRHEAHTTMKRPLRSFGGSHLQDAPEEDVIKYFAEYALSLVLSSGDEYENNQDPNSITCRLKTSLDNNRCYHDDYVFMN